MTAWRNIVVRLSCIALVCVLFPSLGVLGGSNLRWPAAAALISEGVGRLPQEQNHTGVSPNAHDGAAPPELLRAGFESPADRACPPVYASDGLTCMVQPPQGTWFAVSAFSASYLNDPAQCHSGNWCAAITLQPTVRQTNVMWDWLHSLPKQFYVEGWWKFPKNWQWDTADIDHKMIIFETNTQSDARMYLNLRTAGSSQVAQVCVTTGAYIISHSAFVCANRGKKDGVVHADGLWHSIQEYVDEAGNHVQVWLDGTLIIETSALGFGDGAPYKEIKFGAYMGGPAAAKNGGPRTFYMDDLCISTSPCQNVSSSDAAGQAPVSPGSAPSGSNQ